MPQYGDRGRFERAINTLIADGLCWEDDQTGGEIAYWFPSLMTRISGESEDDLQLIGQSV